MEAFSLDVSGREQGILLQNKTFVPLKRPIFSVCNRIRGRLVNFVHASWNSFGTKLVAGDCGGNIYVFFLQKNKFALVQHLKSCCSFLTFTPDKKQDILVAIADCSIISLNSDSRTAINQFNHHSSSVLFISFDKSGQTVLSCCKDRAILWNLNTFHIEKVLTLKKDVDIVKTCFIPGNDIILSSFNDNSVFLWDFKKLTCTSQFVCVSEMNYLNIKSLDVSKDGKLFACAGKTDWFMVFNIPENKELHTMKIPGKVSMVKQIHFLVSWNKDYIVSLLTSDGKILVLNIDRLELMYELQGMRVSSCVPSPHPFQLVTLSLQEGTLDLHDIEDQVMPKAEVTPFFSSNTLDRVKNIRKKKKSQLQKPDVTKKQLLSVLQKFGEYPENHRFFVWSQVLELPHNVDAFKLIHQESLKVKPFIKDYSFINPGVMKTFSRLMCMLVCWHPVIREMNFLQCTVFPFIKICHKNAIMCFELLLTLISNWCQSWFLFTPFPPFHVLCTVENLLAYHDRQLMVHFSKHRLQPEIFAWSLLKTSFSEVVSKQQFLQLWDHLFSNPLAFQMYAVTAFNILMRTHLLQCHSLQQFKSCYRKRIDALTLVKKTYNLIESTPPNIDKGIVIGTFAPLASSTNYPTFQQMARITLDLQTLTRKKIIDQEITYLKQREQSLEIKNTYLKELQDLQMLRRNLLLQTMELKSTDDLESLEKKLQTVQSLIQDNISNQADLFRSTFGGNHMTSDLDDNLTQQFSFSEYLKKLGRTHR